VDRLLDRAAGLRDPLVVLALGPGAAFDQVRVLLRDRLFLLDRPVVTDTFAGVGEFTGTGIAPVGQIISISDRFVNLLPQDVEGVDIGFIWRLRYTPWGSFRVNIDAARLLKFGREAGPAVDALYDARDAGIINAATPLPDSSDLLAQNGRPEWRLSGSLTWSQGPAARASTSMP
jgi:hypothetical protein